MLGECLSSIIHYINPMREELHWVLKYIGAASSHAELSEPTQNPEGRKIDIQIEADLNRRTSPDDWQLTLDR